MALSVRTALAAAFLLGAGTIALSQSQMQKPLLEGIASGKTRVIDLSYALSDKLVPWPGDAKEWLLHAQLLDAGALRNAHGRAGALSSWNHDGR
jgi:hypothetical protein